MYSAPINSLAKNVYYAKVLQAINEYKMHKEQISMLDAAKNAIRRYSDPEQDGTAFTLRMAEELQSQINVLILILYNKF